MINLDTLTPLGANTDEYFTPDSIKQGSDYFIGYSIWDRTPPDRQKIDFGKDNGCSVEDKSMSVEEKSKSIEKFESEYKFHTDIPICYNLYDNNQSLYFYMPDNFLFDICSICSSYINIPPYRKFTGLRVNTLEGYHGGIWDTRINLKFYRDWWRIPLYLYFDFGDKHFQPPIRRIGRYIYGEQYMLFL